MVLGRAPLRDEDIVEAGGRDMVEVRALGGANSSAVIAAWVNVS